MYFRHRVIYDLFMTARDRRDFDVLLDSQAAALERPVATQPYSTFTDLILEDGQIKLSPKARKGVTITPAKGMLEEFVELADADEQKFLEYARRWGFLELCREHWEPASHTHDCEPFVPFRTHVFGTTDKAAREHREKLLAAGEPVSEWRRFARFARALLNVAGRLYEGEMGRDEDWDTLHFDEAGFLGVIYATERRKAKKFPDLDFERTLIAGGVNHWLVAGGVQPKVSWRTSRPVITFECPKPYGKMFANLAIQLMMAVSQADAVAICSACGQSYMPRRRPKTGQRRYCLSCKGVARRDASADYRRRKRGAA